MSLKICYLLKDIGYSGGSQVLYNFMDNLVERGHLVYGVTPYNHFIWKKDYSNILLNRFNKQNDKNILTFSKAKIRNIPYLETILRKIFNLNAKPPKDAIKEVSWLTARLISNWIPCDITISTYYTTSFANYILSQRTISIYHMQAFEEYFSSDPISRMIARLTYFLPLVQIANSSWLKNKIFGLCGNTPAILNPGIDTATYYPKQNIISKYEKMENIVILSYFSPYKINSWNDAVAAMKIVLKQCGNLKIEWIVFGSRPKNIPNMPVTFAGIKFKSELANIYSKAHIVFMNSRYESFPLPPIEAMASGSAVITTNIGTEDYAVNGVNAIVIPAGEPEILADRIIYLIKNPQAACRLAQEGLVTANGFNWASSTDKLESIFEQELQNHHKEKNRQFESHLN